MKVEEMEAPGNSFSYLSCLSVFILLGTLLMSFPPQALAEHFLLEM